MSNVYDMNGKKKVVMEEKEDEDITYKEIMKIIIENATEEDICNYESIGCTKCWTNAVKKIRKEKKLYE